MNTLTFVRASWPQFACPKYGPGNHAFFADLGAYFCEGCGAEVLTEEAILYLRWLNYVSTYISHDYFPFYASTANKWN